MLFAAYIRKCRVGFWQIVDCLVFKCPLVGGGGLVGGISGSRRWPVPTCSHRIAYSSPAADAGMGRRCGVVGVGVLSNLDALANLQADELRKLIENLQGIAASRLDRTPTPTTPQRLPIPASAAGDE